MKGFLHRPRFEDHFPGLRRGHGTTHPVDRRRVPEDPLTKTRNACLCVAEACKGEHINQAANIKDWKEERGISQ